MQWTFDENADTLTNLNGYTIIVPNKWIVPSNSGYIPSLFVLEVEDRKVIEKRFESGITTGHKWSIEGRSEPNSYLISVDEFKSDYLTGQPSKQLIVKAPYGKFSCLNGGLKSKNVQLRIFQK